MRWILIGLISAAQGVSGWYFTMFGVYGLDDFDGSLGVSMLAFPAMLLLAVLGYDERAFLRIQMHERVAVYDIVSGEPVWDRRLPNGHGIPVTVDAILIDERGAFLRMDNHSHAATWFVLDPRTGGIEVTAEEGNLQVIDAMDDAVPEIPGDVVERCIERHRQVSDDGYDSEFTDDAGIERVFRYEDESLLINPVTGRPAGEDHGFTLHQICCRPTALESRAEDGSMLRRLDGTAPSARDVVAETASGRVAILIAGPESKWRLIIARSDGLTEAVIGDRGWLPW